MKKNKILLLFISLLFISCKSINYLKEENLSNVQNIPFRQSDFPNTSSKFYTIQSVVGKNMNINRNRALLAAKNQLAGEIRTNIYSISDLDLGAEDSVEREIFKQRSESNTRVFIEKISLVDSEILYDRNTGKYEYWVVYSVELNDISDLNESQLILNPEEYNKSLIEEIDENIELVASNETDANIYSTILDAGEQAIRKKIETESKLYLGIPYVWGGNTPDEGFDCSGFVRWVYKKSIDKLISRTTLEHTSDYKDIISGEIDQIKKGDLIYFKTLPDRVISHVGIYLEDGLFIHAPNKNEKVKIEDLSGYWLNNFVGFASALEFIN
jgi:hypothetical protein